MPRPVKPGFSTRAIHVGQEPDPATGAVVPPIYQTTTYAQEDLGVHRGYDYSRAANPTRQMLETNLASLEGGTSAIAFASGMAAFTALMTHFRSGDHFIISENVYGGTYRALTQVFNRFGLASSWVDMTKPEPFLAAVEPSTKAIILESPTNPMMSLTDIAQFSSLARERGLLTIVDNTFMTPYCQRPLELGADVVYHSTTKYLCGHSDVIGGVVITSDSRLAADLAFIQKSLGAVPSPFDCWLTLRSLKTLAVRMERHNHNALQLAHFLDGHPNVSRVYFPGLKDHPQYDLALKQQRTPDGQPAFGGMISFETGSRENARKIARALKVFTLAESLGGVESLVNHPVTMTHASVPREQRESFGLTEGLLRLSVGIEDLADLQADLEGALGA
ncbi:MAG: PLP-dependent transferase [Candidatus Marinimicrobia bacterium]|nr:PLP-dependent transferase [Candidatus Neomarinimicrobiota bacterium]